VAPNEHQEIALDAESQDMTCQHTTPLQCRATPVSRPWALALTRCLLVGSLLSVAAGAWAQNQTRPRAAAAQPACWVADFREMALTTHGVDERERKALDWLKRHVQQCSDEQMLMLASNRPAWLGHADTARVAGAIDREFERRYVASQGDVTRLFDSPPAAASTTETTTTPAAPAPVVPAAQNTVPPAAVVIQQPAGSI
jgi:hypothetical protein